VGRALDSKDVVVLSQLLGNRRDNTVAIFRPVDVPLSNSGLDETAFASSVSHGAAARRDELLLFDNRQAGFNKSPSAIFYKFSQTWFLDEVKADSNSCAAANALSASGGLIIRKSQGSNSSSFWTNQPTY
jgi:uncharacterized protein (TIGR02597 family)